ncbi:hypothetical protein QFC19_007722 [Naganishia cerealis]|uniref:Uncharacterized protein n=1 Tax=Naganishia cerealis TaxID=610337 RepID=A0ACC2V902_9TREE|nr:hypothetical protein QFC19_007722 [Naganishia cerealis]
MRPNTKTAWIPERADTQQPVQVEQQDTASAWVTLDRDVPPRRPSPLPVSKSVQEEEEEPLPELDEDNTLLCNVASDVDSILVLCHRLPLCVTLEIPSVPSRRETMQYTNKLCLPVGPGKKRTLLSRIPNFRLGRAGRLTVNMFFPDALDPTHQGFGSSHIEATSMRILWDSVTQPAIVSAFPKGAENSLPESGEYERDRQNETGGYARPSGRSTSMRSDKLEHFVAAIRSLLETSTDPALESYRHFKFLQSLQGYKSFSYTSFEDLTQSEAHWFNDLDLTDIELSPMMLYKGYLKGTRRVTRDVFVPDWLRFNALLQQGIERVRRLRARENHDDPLHDFQVELLSGDDLDRMLLADRRREGPSLQLSPDISRLCDGGPCTTCNIWVDIAVEIGCVGKVNVWNHNRCFDIVDCLIGRENFGKSKEWSTGVRIDEVATMPGLGGVGFTDKKAPAIGNNSPTPYVQLYCQEKVPIYAPLGTKARGAQDLV